MAKKVTDEKLLEMLLVHGGVRGAAVALGISENAIYKRLQNTDFRERYDSLQAVVLSTATARMTSGLEKAVGALLGVLEDQSASPGLRVQAANSLLSHCAKYIETNTIMRRLDALENEMRERENENGKV